MRLPGRQVASLSKTANLRSALDLGLQLAALVFVVAAAHRAQHWVGYLLAAVVIGGLQNRMLVHAHEAWHRKAFSPVSLNQFVGAWIYSYPVGVPFLSDQSRHLAHHRMVGRAEDPDWRDYERAEFRGERSVWAYLVGQLLGMKVLLRLTGASGKAIVSESARAAEKRELAAIVLWQVCLLALFSSFGRPWEYFLLWAIPLGTVTSFIVAFRAYVEHASADAAATPHDRLYDFEAGPLTRFFVSPLLFHLHALHHAYPSVPYSRLRLLQQALREAGLSYPHRERPGYLRSLLEVNRGMHCEEQGVGRGDA